MKIVRRDFIRDGPGSVKMVPIDPEDLWCVYNLIAPGDSVMAATVRKVLREAASGGRDAERVKVKLEIVVEGEQRERKKAEGDGIVYLQGDDDSSVSSSDEDDLDAVEAAFGESGATKRQRGSVMTAAKDFKRKEENKMAKIKREYGAKKRNDTEEFESGKEKVSGSAEASSKDQATVGTDKSEV